MKFPDSTTANQLSASCYERVRSALSHLNPNDRDVWVRAGTCIKAEFGDAGFDLWDEWGSQAESHRAASAQAVWKSINAAGKLQIGSLFYDANQAGWKDDSKYTKPTKEQIEARKATAAACAAQAVKEEAIEHEEISLQSQNIWDASEPAKEHPYLARKGVQAHGLRVGKWERINPETGEHIAVTNNALLIPLRDFNQKIWTLQGIIPDESAKKLFLRGGAVRGHFHPIGSEPLQRDGKDNYVLAEGYATGASIHECTGHKVLVCFTASNLKHVGRLLREQHPGATIIFAADNDTQTEGNPGMRAATEAALEVGGLVAIPPPGDFNDLHQSEGPDAVVDALESAVKPMPHQHSPSQATLNTTKALIEISEHAPSETQLLPVGATLSSGNVDLNPDEHFLILGQFKGSYYVFHHKQRQIKVLSMRDIMSETTMMMLAPIEFWEMNLPKPDGKGGLNKQGFTNWFFRVAELRGVFDPTKVRGRGAWKDAGRLVFHHGGHVEVDGICFSPSHVASEYIYQSATPLPKVVGPYLTDAQGAALWRTVDKAKWSNPASAMFLTGWTFLAPVCGALKWRPHIWLTGASGSGKTTLITLFVSALLKDICFILTGASTEAGIRQNLGNEALPVLLDEFENSNDAELQRISAVMTTIRSASSEGATRTARGSAGGQAMMFDVRSMFCVASINTAIDKSADRSRICLLSLLSPETGAGEANGQQFLEELYQTDAQAPKLSAALLGRSVALLPITLQNISVFSAAVAKHLQSARAGDQFGTLLAGTWGMQSSKLATPEAVAKLVASVDWSDYLPQSEPPDEMVCLKEILGIKVLHGGTTFRLATLIAIVAEHAVDGSNSIDKSAAKRLLNDFDLTVSKSKYLAIAHGSTALSHALRETRFRTDWGGHIKRIPGYESLPATSFGPKPKVRAYGIPLTILQLGSNDEEGPL